MSSPLSKLPFDISNTCIFPLLDWKKTLFFSLCVHPSKKREIIKVVAQKIFDYLETKYGIITSLERKDSVPEFIIRNRENRLMFEKKEHIEELINWYSIVVHNLPYPKTLREFVLIHRRMRELKQRIESCRTHLEHLNPSYGLPKKVIFPIRSFSERETQVHTLNVNFEGREEALQFQIFEISRTFNKFSISLNNGFEIVVENFLAMCGFPREYRVKVFSLDRSYLKMRFITQLIFEIFQDAVIIRNEKVKLSFNEHIYSIEGTYEKMALYTVWNSSVDQIGSTFDPQTDWKSQIEKHPIFPRGFTKDY